MRRLIGTAPTRQLLAHQEPCPVKILPMKSLAASAALIALLWIPPAAAQSGNGQFCISTAAGARCVFDTMGDCERVRGSASSAQCMTRTDAHGTTGLGEPLARSFGIPTESRPSATDR
jgi:hypothetical protein